MNWWLLYPLIGLAIFTGLVSVDAIDVGSRGLMILLMSLWPLALPFLIWHGITVLQWKRMSRRRGEETAKTPPTRRKVWQWRRRAAP